LLVLETAPHDSMLHCNIVPQIASQRKLCVINVAVFQSQHNLCHYVQAIDALNLP